MEGGKGNKIDLIYNTHIDIWNTEELAVRIDGGNLYLGNK